MSNLAMVMPEPGAALQLVERPVPEPGPREAVMRVRATSMNYHDLVNLKGMLKFGPWPRVPMTDGAGEIVAVGAQVRSLKVGDRVNAPFTPEWLSGRPTPASRRVVLGDTTDGCLQQYLALDERSFVRVPAHLTDDEAATIPCAGVTAWSSLVAGGLKPGDVVLAEGTGGVSLFTVQLAKAAGARVILTSSSDDKLAIGQALGADDVINYRTTPDWAAAVRELTGGRGADIVVDVGGAATLAGSVRAAAMGGTVAIMGVLGGAMSAELPLSAAMQANLRLVGITVGSVADHADCSRAIAQADFRPHISHRFDWTQMAEAMATMESQQQSERSSLPFPETGESNMATTREKLGIGHPILDMDGHVVEIFAATKPFLREAMGEKLFTRYIEREQAVLYGTGRAPASLAERLDTREPRKGWWTQHTKDAFERALPMFPQMLYEHLDSLGIDYAVLYPTNALTICSVDDPDIRLGLVRGYNEYFAATYNPYADRLTAAGIVSMHTPEEALESIEQCHRLGLKVIGLPEGVLRPIRKVSAQPARWMYPNQTHWFDVFGLDGEHSYDVVWQRASELKLAVSFHGGLSPRPGVCTSISNFSFNHVGMFMQSMYPLCKALFMGGVTKRFPNMGFAMLECGVSWAAPLLSDMCEHWEKRRPEVMGDFDPAALNLDEVLGFARKYGGALFNGDIEDTLSNMPIFGPPPDDRDDWAAIGAQTRTELCEAFADAFYFGCEADDHTVGVAFGRRSGLPVDLKPTLGSDIGHWDVAHAHDVIPEAWESVEHGYLSEGEFRAFTYSNARHFLERANPDFFAHTVLA